ncbi:MAG: hypothetical protein WCF99_14135 [Chloroflexales bacterium]
MRQRILTLIVLLAFVLLVAGPQLARAQNSTDHTPSIVVDGYTLTLTSPTEAATGNATVIVTLRDARQQPVTGAIVSASLLAYLPAADGHGAMLPSTTRDAHGADTGMAGMPGMEDATSAPATSVTDSMAGMPGMEGMAGMVTATAVPPATAHDHGAASATEGYGLPVLLHTGDAPGSYQGTLSFDQPGTWTVGVVFTIDGQEHGTTFDLAVAQGRPRGLVLGGFAAINALAILTAAILRHRKPRTPARPAPAAATAEVKIADSR